ncbi:MULTISPECIES: hypothetical protein [Rhizobium]|uniref:hypothetical protein n=1 Tax=Rhizobium TaxID=379 RepID=UPI000BE93185|nr:MULTISPECIES: hypothetical protein [Rhizobium]MBY4591806.1 hypothetical protein [Rhizobium redzepovicii]MBY4616294.1 hypothetical protein [Rhizobium redzepovicii]MDF0662457.1 hypothetical protein [Rhizobium sp. BC49]MDR9784835.1 hypothetical protein [Rhizobium redzepovicii]PDS83584.1 hypothetical protein CO654_19450 [Rhizobium sp. L18]
MNTSGFDKPDYFGAADLRICQGVFDIVTSEAGVEPRSEEGERIAAIVVQLYRQGVKEPDRLRVVVESARGINIAKAA